MAYFLLPFIPSYKVIYTCLFFCCSSSIDAPYKLFLSLCMLLLLSGDDGRRRLYTDLAPHGGTVLN